MKVSHYNGLVLEVIAELVGTENEATLRKLEEIQAWKELVDLACQDDAY